MAKRMTMNANKDNKAYKETVVEFTKHCGLKNLTQKTMDFYLESLGNFTKFMEREDFMLNEISSTTIEDYTFHLKDSGIKSISVNTRLRGLRAFLYWCMDRGYMNAFKMKLVKQEEIIKPTFTDEEIMMMLRKPDIRNCTFTEYRNWAMVNFFVATGVRVSTLISIRIEDIDLQSSIFRTRHNKNRREQILPISKALNGVLTEYLIYRKHKSDEEVLFCNQYGYPLTDDGCENIISKYGQRRGVMNCNCHKFRHTFAKNWILSGGDVFRLQKILGHSSMDVVKKYVNIYGVELQKDFEQFNPLDRLSQEKKSIQMEKQKQPRK